jgi:hypothetical protein
MTFVALMGSDGVFKQCPAFIEAVIDEDTNIKMDAEIFHNTSDSSAFVKTKGGEMAGGAVGAVNPPLLLLREVSVSTTPATKMCGSGCGVGWGEGAPKRSKLRSLLVIGV